MELLVVITILAILSVTAFISYVSSNANVRDATRKTDMEHMKMSLKTIKQQKGSYPQVTGTQTNLSYSGTTSDRIIATE